MNKSITLAMLMAVSAAVPPTVRAAELISHWDFESLDASDSTRIKSTVGGFIGAIVNEAKLTAAGGGRPNGGGKGFDVGQANPGWLRVDPEEFPENASNMMDKAFVDDHATVVLWQKNYSSINSSSFWAVGPGGQRGFQFHIPWSNGTIYFDTSGCCGADTRIQQDAKAALGDDFDFNVWHHYAFVKDGEGKRMYVDGKLLKETAEGYSPLAAGYGIAYIGSQAAGSPVDAVIDDFAIFKGVLSEADILKLVAGARPGGEQKDTDKDGMPDDWEVANGFNPNDASDAAKDADGDGATNLAEYKAGTDPIDTTKPTLVSAVGTATFDSVVLTFSEVVDPTAGADLKNYTITPSLAVTAAAVKKNIVTLTTAKQTAGATAYTVAVIGVTDGSKNVIAAGAKARFYSYVNVKNGILKFSYWGNIPGNAVDALLSDPRYPATPDQVLPVYSFNSRDAFPNDSHEAYGAAITGYITPETSGDYVFFLTTDDNGALWLSTDDKPANKKQIAAETAWSGNRQWTTSGGSSDLASKRSDEFPGTEWPTGGKISLLAGKKYYVEMIYKEGGGGDLGQVAWKKTTDTTPEASLSPIPGQFLSSVDDLAAAPEGAFVTLSPGANAKGVTPNAHVIIAHRDGKTEWTAANVSLKIDGGTVTPKVAKVGTVLTIDYGFPSLAASASVHTVSLSYLDAGGLPATRDWSYTTQVYGGPAKDKVGGYTAILTGKAAYTADKGGATGKAGDYGMDFTKLGGPVISYDETFLSAANAATAKDELSVAFWQKKYDIADSSAFDLQSPTTGNQRTFHAHVPWSNGHVYFDTTGCCNGETQRIETDIATFSGYSGELSWWTNQWHLFVFTKKADVKQVWIDGLLFFEGNNTGVMATDNNAFLMGADGGGGAASHAIVDDFSVYSKQLVSGDILALSKGTLPTALPASKGLIAYWDFNEGAAKPAPKFTSIKVTGINVTLTWEGGGTLQVANEITGPWVDIPAAAGGVSPLTTTADQARRFARIKQ